MTPAKSKALLTVVVAVATYALAADFPDLGGLPVGKWLAAIAAAGAYLLKHEEVAAVLFGDDAPEPPRGFVRLSALGVCVVVVFIGGLPCLAYGGHPIVALAIFAVLFTVAIAPASRRGVAGLIGLALLVPLALGPGVAACSTLKDAVPALTQADAVGRGVAHVLGWCDAQEPDAVTAAKIAAARGDYAQALQIAEGIVTRSREAGVEVPESVEVTLRLAEGAVGAEAVQNAARALAE